MFLQPIVAVLMRRTNQLRLLLRMRALAQLHDITFVNRYGQRLLTTLSRGMQDRSHSHAVEKTSFNMLAASLSACMRCTQGKPSLTQWSVIGRTSPDNVGGDGIGIGSSSGSSNSSGSGMATTRVELTPVTGRSHQLRLHMQSIGHPILGDDLYAHEAAKAAAPRCLLHATSLAFTHPITQEAMSFDLPPDF